MAERATKSTPTVPNFLLLFLSLVLGYLAQYYARRSLPLTDSFILYGLAAFCFLVAVRPLPRSPFPVETPQVPRPVPWVRRWLVASCLAVALACAGGGLRWFGAGLNLSWAWGLYLASLVTVALGGLVLDRGWRSEVGANDPPKRSSATHLCLLVAVLLVALYVRLDRLDTLPFGLWFDESVHGLEALKLLGPGGQPVVYSVPTFLPTVFLYLVGAPLKLLGQNMFALRLTAAVFGLLTVVVFYVLVKELFRTSWLALAGAFLMAVARWDINWSRIAMHGVTTPYFTVLVAYLFWRALRRRRWLDWVLAGLALGAGLWFYAPFRLFPAVIMVLVVAWWLRRRGSFRRTVLPILYSTLVVALTIAPIALFAYCQPVAFFARTLTTSVFQGKTWEQGKQALVQNLQKHLLMFTHRGDANGRHNLPGEPMLDFLVSPLAVLGLAYSLYRWQDPRYLTLLAWFAVMLQGGVLSLDFEAPQSLRAIGTLPVAYLFALVALEQIGTGFQSALRRRYGIVLCGGLTAWLLVTAYVNYDTYFRRQAGDFASWNAFSTGETIFAKGLAQLNEEDYDVYASSLFAHPSVRFLAPNRRNYEVFDPSTTLPLRSTKGAVALFLEPHRELGYERLKEYYPAAVFREVRLRPGSPAIAFTGMVERRMVEALQGVDIRYYRGPTEEKNLLGMEQVSNIDVDWRSKALPSLPLTVEWDGTLLVPTYGVYRLALQDSPFTRVYLNETPVIVDQPNGEASLTLAQGNHRLRVLTEVRSYQQQTRLFWRRPQGEWEPIPRDFLYVPPVKSQGLLGRYYTNSQRTGAPALARVDPMLAVYFDQTPLPRPYSVEWTGTLLVEEDATHTLGLEVISRAQLFLDGHLVLDAATPNKLVTTSLPLSAGPHRIQVTYVDQDDYSHIYLYWAREGRELEYVPAEALLPWEQ